MKHLYWLQEGMLAGRCGPGEAPWELAELKAAGIGAVVSLTEVEGEGASFSAAGLEHLYLPMVRNVPPREDDAVLAAEVIGNALNWVATQQQAGKAVLVHCALGNDRTGLLLASYLMQQGAAPLHAVSQVRNLREAAFTAEGWDQFVYDVLYSLHN